MNYATAAYFVFLPLCLLAYSLAPSPRIRHAVLLLASFAFYSAAGVFDFAIFVAVLCLTWTIAKGGDFFPKSRRSFIAGGIALLTAHLFLWKYGGAVATATGGNWPYALPLGVSFFTLQGIAYLLDLRRGGVGLAPLSEFLLFKSFFPQLVMGPIVRASALLPQLGNLAALDLGNARVGLGLILLGLAKKLLVADRLAPTVDRFFEAPLSFTSVEGLAALTAFWVVFWADFSGYTDMARGSARLFGIRLPENFLAPYWASSPSDFWRRWHATFSTWLRDYIYIPLGGNRGGALGNTARLWAVLLLSALWHEAGLHQIIFGTYHAIGIGLHRVWKRRNQSLPTPLAWAGTQAFVFVGWVFFRSPTLETGVDVFRTLLGMSTSTQPLAALGLSWQTALGYALVVLAAQRLSAQWENYGEKLRSPSRQLSLQTDFVWGVLFGVSFFSILYFRPSELPLAFLYFQF